jgi:hypothetical protein
VSVLVVKCTGNADGRFSHDVLVGRHVSLLELASYSLIGYSVSIFS